VLSSDCPVSAFEPLKSIQATVDERTGSGEPYTPEEALTVYEAIHHYTVEGAYASFEEQEKGMIKAGMLADFAILGHDPSSVPSSEIAKTPVLATVIGGELVYQA
jgi:predicted amidohydrolase YtcJ